MASSTVLTYGPGNVDSLLTTTRDAVLKLKGYLQDALFNESVLLNHLNNKKRILMQGGASILVPLLYEANSTFAAYSGDDTLDTSGQEGLTMAQASWRNYGGTIKYAGDEIRMNGAEKLHDLASAKIMQAQMSGRDALSTDLFASSQASKKVQTLVTLVDATSNIQAIYSTNYSWWQATNTTSGSFAAQGLDDMRTLRNTLARCGQGGSPLPDFYLTTQTVLEYYEASQVPALRYSSSDKPDAGKEDLYFSGAPIKFDANCNSGVLYALPSDALHFAVHSDANWDMSPFQKPPQQDVYIAQLIWMGNLVTSNRRRLGKLNTISA